jgi:trehalose 6-phosphate synthase
MARAIDRALSMPIEERQERHQAMLKVMRTNSLEQWRDRFETDLRGG